MKSKSMIFLLRSTDWMSEEIHRLNLEIVRLKNAMEWGERRSVPLTPEQALSPLPLPKGGQKPSLAAQIERMDALKSERAVLLKSYQIMQAELSKLPENERELLIDYYMREKTYKEIAQKHGISEKQIRKHVTRVLNHIEVDRTL